jgi:hypothetical protein
VIEQYRHSNINKWVMNRNETISGCLTTERIYYASGDRGFLWAKRGAVLHCGRESMGQETGAPAVIHQIRSVAFYQATRVEWYVISCSYLQHCLYQRNRHEVDCNLCILETDCYAAIVWWSAVSFAWYTVLRRKAGWLSSKMLRPSSKFGSVLYHIWLFNYVHA